MHIQFRESVFYTPIMGQAPAERASLERAGFQTYDTHRARCSSSRTRGVRPNYNGTFRGVSFTVGQELTLCPICRVIPNECYVTQQWQVLARLLAERAHELRFDVTLSPEAREALQEHQGVNQGAANLIADEAERLRAIERQLLGYSSGQGSYAAAVAHRAQVERRRLEEQVRSAFALPGFYGPGPGPSDATPEQLGQWEQLLGLESFTPAMALAANDVQAARVERITRRLLDAPAMTNAPAGEPAPTLGFAAVAEQIRDSYLQVRNRLREMTPLWAQTPAARVLVDVRRNETIPAGAAITYDRDGRARVAGAGDDVIGYAVQDAVGGQVQVSLGETTGQMRDRINAQLAEGAWTLPGLEPAPPAIPAPGSPARRVSTSIRTGRPIRHPLTAYHDEACRCPACVCIREDFTVDQVAGLLADRARAAAAAQVLQPEVEGPSRFGLLEVDPVSPAAADLELERILESLAYFFRGGGAGVGRFALLEID